MVLLVDDLRRFDLRGKVSTAHGHSGEPVKGPHQRARDRGGELKNNMDSELEAQPEPSYRRHRILYPAEAEVERTSPRRPARKSPYCPACLATIYDRDISSTFGMAVFLDRSKVRRMAHID